MNRSVHLHTPLLGAARSLLALSTLLNLAFNEPRVLFAAQWLNTARTIEPVARISMFELVSPDRLWLVQLGACLVLAVTVAGFLPRFTAPLQLWISWSYAVSCTVVEGGDQINSIACLLLLPVALLDARRNHHERSASVSVSPWRTGLAWSTAWVVRLQVSVLYFHAAVGKLGVREWRDGTAVHYFFRDPVFGMGDAVGAILTPVLRNPLGVVSLTWGTLLLELALVASPLFSPRGRLRMFYAALAFHLGIVLVHGLMSFFLSMAGMLVLHLLPVLEKVEARAPSAERAAEGGVRARLELLVGDAFRFIRS